MHRVFLLSPATLSGARGSRLLEDQAEFDLAVRLRGEGASIGEVFAFVSGLYFRGKSAYSSAFAAPPPGVSGSLVIAAGRGLQPKDAKITLGDLRSMARVSIDAENPLYREPLERDARKLAKQIPPDCEVVLLGSIATPKYLEPLMAVFGEKLLFPSEFAGRGDMSRGGLMLRCVRDGVELDYIPAHSAVRSGARPPRLAKAPTRRVD